MFRAYPQMLYHPDGRKKVVRDEQHHAEMAREGFCAIDDDGRLILVEEPDEGQSNAFDAGPVTVRDDPLISEAVRDMAEASGIDWRTVEGTGKDGRVLKSDIQKLIHDNDHPNG